MSEPVGAAPETVAASDSRPVLTAVAWPLTVAAVWFALSLTSGWQGTSAAWIGGAVALGVLLVPRVFPTDAVGFAWTGWAVSAAGYWAAFEPTFSLLNASLDEGSPVFLGWLALLVALAVIQVAALALAGVAVGSFLKDEIAHLRRKRVA